MPPKLSRYDVVGLIASGGMADVWLARMRGPAGFAKVVALKTIRPALTDRPEFTDLFLSEARAAAKLNHPNCVQIFDLGEEHGSYFLAMEYIDGFSFKRVLARERERGSFVPLDIVARIVMDAANGLDFAHQLTSDDGQPAGIVHRDVSPDNILVALSGQCKLADFGIAKAVAAAASTRSTNLKGKAGYMAPEYLRGEPIDGRADLFALGVVVYRALTAQSPFEAQSDPLALLAILTEQPAPVRSLNANVPEAVADVVAKALAKDPAARYQSARELRDALAKAAPSVATPEAVAEYMETLWPKNDPERQRIRAFIATPASGNVEPSSTGPETAGAARTGETNAAAAITSEAPPPVPAHRRPILAVTCFAAAAAIAVGAVVAHGRLTQAPRSSVAPDLPPRRASENVSVLVADVENRSGDPVFDETLESPLCIGIEQAAFVSCFSRARARKVAREVRDGGDALDEQTARLVAIREGAAAVVSGAIVREGDAYAVSVRVLDAVTGTLLARLDERAPTKVDVLPSVTKLAGSIRRTLGDTVPPSVSIEAQDTYTTSSLEAAHEFGLARNALTLGDWDAARAHAERALALDPEMARAYAILGVLHSNRRQQVEADKYFKLALSRVDRMTEREKLRTLGTYFNLVVHDASKAVEVYTTLVQKYPADTEGNSNLALAYCYARQLQRALEQGYRAIAIHPESAIARYNVASYALYAGDFETAQREADAALKMSPKWAPPHSLLALVEMGRRRPNEAAKEYERLAGDRAADLARAAGLADAALFEGRTSDAIQLLEAATRQPGANDEPEVAGAVLATLAWANLAARQTDRAIVAADRAIAASTETRVVFPAAQVYIDAGRVPKAAALASMLDRRLDAEARAHAKILMGEIALEQKKPRDGVQAFEEARRLLDVWIVHVDLARAYLAVGAHADALAQIDEATKRSGEGLALFFDEYPTARYVPAVFYYKAKVLGALGSPAAADAYRDFLAIKRDAEKDPQVDDARARSARW